MANPHFPELSPEQFHALADAYEAGGDALAASALLEMCGGDARRAESYLWGTWEKHVGGSPGARPAEAVASDVPRFLMRLVGVIADGTESPKVARVSPFVAA